MNPTPIIKLFPTINNAGKQVGRILIKPATIQTTIGGFSIPEVDQKKDKPEAGEIVMLSDDITHLKIGDLILYGRFAGVKFKHESVEYLVINSDEAYAVLDKDKISVA